MRTLIIKNFFAITMLLYIGTLAYYVSQLALSERWFTLYAVCALQAALVFIMVMIKRWFDLHPEHVSEQTEITYATGVVFVILAISLSLIFA